MRPFNDFKMSVVLYHLGESQRYITGLYEDLLN